MAESTLYKKKKKPVKPERPSNLVKRVKDENEVMRDLDELKNLEEPIPSPPKAPGKAKGRAKNPNFLPYTEAREFMHGEMIPNRIRFDEWWNNNKPKAIPRFPYRVYKDWVSWNDFLGNNNTFGLKVAKQYRSLEEAARWVHTQRIQSYSMWMKFIKLDDRNLPEDIPARPDLVYKGWKSWNHWLGNKVEDVLNVSNEIKKLQIYYIIHTPGNPENMFTFGVDTLGPAAFKERWQREKFNIIRMFWYEPDHAENIKKLVDSLSTPWYDDERQRVCPNIWEINYFLELAMQRIYKLD